MTPKSFEGLETPTTLTNCLIDKVKVIPAPVDAEGKRIPGKKDRATGRIVQYNRAGQIQWSRFFVTWDCVSQVSRFVEDAVDNADPILGVAEPTAPVTQGDMSDESDKETRERQRTEYSKVLTIIGNFSRRYSKADDKYYENFVITEIH